MALGKVVTNENGLSVGAGLSDPFNAQGTKEFFHFWGLKSEDQSARTSSWQHLSDVRIGDKRYDLRNADDFQAFQNDLKDGVLDGKGTSKDGNVLFNDGVITTANGAKYDIRKPEDVLRLKVDSSDGKIDGNYTPAESLKDGVDHGISHHVNGGGGLTAQERSEFGNFWGLDPADQRNRANEYAHLTRLKFGDKTYDLSDPKQWKAFTDVIGKSGDNVAINNGKISVPGKTYDIRNPKDVIALREDFKDGKLDGKIAEAKGSTKPQGTTGTSGSNGAGGTPAPSTTAEPRGADGPKETRAPGETPAPENAPQTKVASPTNYKGMSLQQLLLELLRKIGAKEEELKGKLKDLGTQIDAAGGPDKAPQELKTQLLEIQQTLQQLNEITNLITSLSKSDHDMKMSVIRNISV
jgi:hypothetical protein